MKYKDKIKIINFSFTFSFIAMGFFALLMKYHEVKQTALDAQAKIEFLEKRITINCNK
jgi:hypothetical protein